MSAPAVYWDGWLGVGGIPLGKPDHRWTVRLPLGHDLADVAAACEGAGSDVVYVLPEDKPGTLIYRNDIPGELRDLWRGEPSGGGDGAPVWRVRMSRRDAPARAVSVVFLDGDEGRQAGPWQGLDARGLVSAFEAFRRLVGVDWADSIGQTAERLILSTHPRRKGGRTLDRAVMPPPAEGGALEQAWQSWRRDLTEAEQSCTHVHSFDGNAQYLAAWGVAELGHGQAVHHTAPTFDGRRVGFWRYPELEAMRNPLPLLPAPWLPGREWFTTPTIARMLEVCEGLDVPLPAEAWIWPEKSRYLRPAADKLRDARAAAMNEAAASRAVLRTHLDEIAEVERRLRRVVTADCVLEAVKAIYQIETGRFAMGRAEGSLWARPDWGHLVRATARVNLHRRLHKLTAPPFAIMTDGLLFASSEPDAATFAKTIGLPLGDGLGYYSHEGTASMAGIVAQPTVVRMFSAVGNGSHG